MDREGGIIFTFKSLKIFLPTLGIYILLFYGMYISAGTVMIKWWSRDDYSYCYLVPLIVIFLLWENRSSIFNKVSEPDWKGLIPLSIGISLYWLGELGGEFYILYISFWLILIGLCLLHMGIKKVKGILFSLFFILTMFPLPNFFNNRITLELKLMSSKLGVKIIQAYGMSAHREGNIIDLGFTQLQVVDACSGLRYLYPLLVLGILLSYFYKGQLWKKLFIVLSAIPLTIFTNSLRIAFTGILSEAWGTKIAEGFFHDFEGWIIFMLTLGFLLFEMWILKKVFPIQKQLINKEKKDENQTVTETCRSPSWKQPQFFFAIIFLSSTLILSHSIEFREKTPINKSFDSFPMQVENWNGLRQSMEQKFIDTLDLSDYVIIDFKNEKGKDINFYVAYYESQSKGESIHSPETCLPGSGWIFKNEGEIDIQAAKEADNKMPVNRALMEKSGYRQLVYYWFPQRGRILTNAYQLKLYTFWDALTRQRTDGALVRLITSVYPDEEIEDAENRMQGFVKDIVPILREFIPE